MVFAPLQWQRKDVDDDDAKQGRENSMNKEKVRLADLPERRHLERLDRPGIAAAQAVDNMISIGTLGSDDFCSWLHDTKYYYSHNRLTAAVPVAVPGRHLLEVGRLLRAWKRAREVESA